MSDPLAFGYGVRVFRTRLRVQRMMKHVKAAFGRD